MVARKSSGVRETSEEGELMRRMLGREGVAMGMAVDGAAQGREGG